MSIDRVVAILEADWWNGIAALATVAAAVSVGLAAKQLSFDAWNKAQDIISDETFKADRARIFRFLDEPLAKEHEWTNEDDTAGCRICVYMTELFRLAPYFALFPSRGRLKLIRAWDEQIAKSSILLQPLIDDEYVKVGGSRKWDDFISAGRDAYRRLPEQERLRIRAGGIRVRSLSRFTKTPVTPDVV